MQLLGKCIWRSPLQTWILHLCQGEPIIFKLKYTRKMDEKLFAQDQLSEISDSEEEEEDDLFQEIIYTKEVLNFLLYF